MRVEKINDEHKIENIGKKKSMSSRSGRTRKGVQQKESTSVVWVTTVSSRQEVPKRSVRTVQICVGQNG